MFLGIVRAMLGPLSGILDWAEAHPDTVALAFGVWTLVWLAGNAQLRNVRRQTRRLVLEQARVLLAKRPGMSARGLYQAIYPSWAASLPRWALFIPHRLEMWPIPAKPELVRERLGFTAEWIKHELKAGVAEV